MYVERDRPPSRQEAAHTQGGDLCFHTWEPKHYSYGGTRSSPGRKCEGRLLSPPGALTHSCKHLPSWAKGGEGARLPRVLRGRCLFYGCCELWHGNGDERRDHGLRDWELTARCQVVLVAGESSGRLPCPWCCQQGAKS